MPRRTPPRDPDVEALLAWLDAQDDTPPHALSLPPASFKERQLTAMLNRLPRTGAPLWLPESDDVGLLP